mmetsp:Transcript_50518/g.163549  ORF Transcript_50518/g.163549 Transcript_50518/m.163549 type:complete len:683 (-) Transcript_50518:145-2193(-)
MRCIPCLPRGSSEEHSRCRCGCLPLCMRNLVTCCLGRDGGDDARHSPSINGSQLSTGSSAGPPAQPHERTSKHSTFRLRCAERSVPGMDNSYPVKLIVFDFDETISMVTFMAKDSDTPAERKLLRDINFETPWVDGSRLEKLKQLLQALAKGEDGRDRALTILTKNSNRNGISGVLQLLTDADLARFFDAMWIMPARPGQHSGVYQEDGKWILFDPPIDKVVQFKSDVLQHVATNPQEWFPQLLSRNGKMSPLQRLLMDLRMEGVVLVDDQRFNFQSETTQLLRYCKVARYDAAYRCVGFQKDMGGIGAHSDADYETLRRFVEDPWMCKETLQVRCSARPLPAEQERNPVKLVVFDFDETLTMATFMPRDEGCESTIGWLPSDELVPEWTAPDLIQYNFESPWASGSRVARLQSLFQSLVDGSVGQPRALAILTRNQSGVVAVLNLLRIAGLDQHFSVIWTMPAKPDVAAGAYQVDGKWTTFDPPVSAWHDHKADLLANVVTQPEAWFPQLANGKASDEPRLGSLRHLSLENVVLVDDERANFRTDSEQSMARVLRYCKVARYDETYRNCGSLNQMGGIGAHSEADYETLQSFVEQPWNFPYEPSPGLGVVAASALHTGAAGEGGADLGEGEGHVPEGRQREVEPKEQERKLPRVRTSGSPDLSSFATLPQSTSLSLTTHSL